VVRENSKPHLRGHYLSLCSAAGTAGLVITSLLFGFFIRMWGWKITCFLLSLPGYLLAYAYLKSKKGKKNHKVEAERKIKKGYIYLLLAWVFEARETGLFFPFYPFVLQIILV
ncbi:hypothetical protein KA005_33810, partial [bacterium]|nr:hypothetical protein [bacterium]